VDLVGNAGEWVLDWFANFYSGGTPCVDCVNLGASGSGMRTVRGGWFWDFPGMLTTDERTYGTPDFRVIGAGARCARSP
jgi:formylglycine-generating enzyme required for sulfatase activity